MRVCFSLFGLCVCVRVCVVSVISVGLNELQTPVAEHFGEVTVFSAGLFAFLVERMKSECPSINQCQ